MKIGKMVIVLLAIWKFTAAMPYVTYELSPGRFGDNLMSYYHAKWISYKYGVPLLYKSFIHSEELMISNYEKSDAFLPQQYFQKTLKLVNPARIEKHQDKDVLFFVPYFPESQWEKENCISFAGGKWEYFPIDWEDKGFIKELKKIIQPRNPLPRWDFPNDRISVAIHMRKGGYHDTPPTLLSFPLKFLPDSFYYEQLEKICRIVKGKPLYVFLFTDDPDPVRLKQGYEKRFEHEDVLFDCRRSINHDRIHVIEDFFALSLFDCIIHGESNYALCISLISDYAVQIYPYSFHKEKGQIIIDGIHVKINQQLLKEL